ncbi:hypothetical protein K503DRAFT_788222, partial [Rhizopogon vinicolor AM-OR11-026]
MTFTHTAERYLLHVIPVLHTSECPGQDIVCDTDGFWRGVTGGIGYWGEVVVDAGQIRHRGCVIHEPTKACDLDDAFDASPIILLIQPAPDIPTPVSLLIHEATDSYITRHIDLSARQTKDEVESKVAARGHSTPVMADSFAKEIGASTLILNHIGSR